MTAFVIVKNYAQKGRRNKTISKQEQKRTL